MSVGLFVAVFGAALVLFAVVHSLRFFYSYRVANGGVEIVLFQALPVYRVPIEDIDLIQKRSWSELGVGGSTLRLGNRLARECVVIQKRGGVIRRIVITPGNADGFIRQVNARQKKGHSS